LNTNDFDKIYHKSDRKRKAMAGGEFDADDEVDYDFAKMVNEEWGCSSRRIPGWKRTMLLTIKIYCKSQ
jgi:hypothetical protein